MSGASKLEKIRSKTARKLLNREAITTLSNLKDVFEAPFLPDFEVEEPTITFPERHHIIAPPTEEKGEEKTEERGIPPAQEPASEEYKTIFRLRGAKRRPSFEERLQIVKSGIDQILTDLEKAVKKSSRDNEHAITIQKILSMSLFIVGIALVAFGLLQNQGAVVGGGAIVNLLIVWPYRNFTKIKNENTFLNSLIPWLKSCIAPCELLKKGDEIKNCYTNGLNTLREWMLKLQESAY